MKKILSFLLLSSLLFTGCTETEVVDYKTPEIL